jgi:hypothetical protein
MNYITNFSFSFSTLQRFRLASLQILALLWGVLTSETFKVSLVLSTKVLLFGLIVAIRAMLLTIEYIDKVLTEKHLSLPL